MLWVFKYNPCFLKYRYKTDSKKKNKDSADWSYNLYEVFYLHRGKLQLFFFLKKNKILVDTKELTTYKVTPAKFCTGVFPVAILKWIYIMEKQLFKVVQIGDETKNGNVIVKIQRKDTVEDEFGESLQSETYYRAVVKDSVKVKVGQEMPDFNPDNYRIVEREHTFVVNEGTDEEETVVVKLKWLHNK